MHAPVMFQLCATPWTVSHPAPQVYGILPSRSTEMGGYFTLQRFFPAWGSSLHLSCLLQWQADSLSLAPSGKPKPLKLKFWWLESYLGSPCGSHRCRDRSEVVLKMAQKSNSFKVCIYSIQWHQFTPALHI